jgi:aryl-alcohol dehydrogenase-like predicted oxidoreductase
MTRRRFLAGTLASAGVLVSGRPAWAADPKPKLSGTDVVSLGRTGIKVSRLAQGTGFNGSKRSSAQTRLGQEACTGLLRHGFDQGVTFLDMADLYGSHQYVRDALKGYDRSKFVLLSKIWLRQEDWNQPSGGALAEVDRYRQELNSDMLDICLLHCTVNEQWPTQFERVRDELSELKQKGVVRAVGTSCHDLGALKVAAEHPWVDVIFARINNKGGRQYSMDGEAEEVSAVLKKARANGKAVVGMKIFGAGKLIEPEQKETSLRYVWSNELVDAITIGMLSTEQVDDTLARMKTALNA